LAETHEVVPEFGWTLQVDSNGDLYFDNDNRLQIIGGKKNIAGNEINTIGNKVEQDLQILFRTMLGDNIFHANVGLDFVTIMASNFQSNVVTQLIKRAFNTYAFKSSIDDIQVIDTRNQGGTSQIWNVKVRVGSLGYIQFQVGFQ